MNKKATGHLAALVTILIWGTTFISTKVLLVDFEPIEILFFRFIMGFLALLIVYPRRMKKNNQTTGSGLCSGRTVWHMPVLSSGEHRIDLYNGFQRRCDYFHRTFFHSDAHSPIHKR